MDLDERLLPARGEVVDGPGEEALPRPALARDEHGGVGVLHHVDHVEDPPDVRGLPDDVAERELPLPLLGEPLDLLEAPEGNDEAQPLPGVALEEGPARADRDDPAV